jgi:DnaJ-domain-containing protein 1
MAKPRKTFAEMAAERPKYDPNVEGYGDPDEWRGAFKQRMGLEEAQKVVGSRSARLILGLGIACSWEDVVKAYRRKMLEVHPDRRATSGLSEFEATQKTKEVNAAFSLLAKEFGK